MKMIRSSVIAGVVWLSMVLGGWLHAGETHPMDTTHGGMSFSFFNHSSSQANIEMPWKSADVSSSETGTEVGGRIAPRLSISRVNAGARFGYKDSTIRINYHSIGWAGGGASGVTQGMGSAAATETSEIIAYVDLKLDGTTKVSEEVSLVAAKKKYFTTVYGKKATVTATWHGTGWTIEVK